MRVQRLEGKQLQSKQGDQFGSAAYGSPQSANSTFFMCQCIFTHFNVLIKNNITGDIWFVKFPPQEVWAEITWSSLHILAASIIILLQKPFQDHKCLSCMGFILFWHRWVYNVSWYNMVWKSKQQREKTVDSASRCLHVPLCSWNHHSNKMFYIAVRHDCSRLVRIFMFASFKMFNNMCANNKLYIIIKK